MFFFFFLELNKFSLQRMTDHSSSVLHAGSINLTDSRIAKMNLSAQLIWKCFPQISLFCVSSLHNRLQLSSGLTCVFQLTVFIFFWVFFSFNVKVFTATYFLGGNFGRWWFCFWTFPLNFVIIHFLLFEWDQIYLYSPYLLRWHCVWKQQLLFFFVIQKWMDFIIIREEIKIVCYCHRASIIP